MTTPERRHLPRFTLGAFAYLQIEPGNAGIIRDVSGEGLCFEPVAPLQRSGPIQFCLQDHNRLWLMPGCGELVWVDEAKGRAGLRFTTLSPEGRNQIEEWAAAASAPLPVEEHAPTQEAVLVTDSAAAAAAPAHEEAVPAESSPLPATPVSVAAPSHGGGFSAGLATGVIISVVWVAFLSFSYSHRQQLGRSLISLGERLTAHSEVQPKNVQPAEVPPQNPSPAEVQAQEAPAPQVVAPSLTPASAEAPPPIEAKLAAQRPPAPLRPSVAGQLPAKTQSLASIDAPAAPERNPSLSVATVRPPAGPITQHSALTASVPPALNLPTPGAPFPKLMFSETPALTQPVAAAVRASRLDPSSSTLQMYFDLGRFSDELVARNAGDKVAQLGLRTTVLRRRFLWKTSYQLLVGPYSNEEEEARIENDLVLRGYKPRPFERGSRRFLFNSRLSLNGARLPVGDQFTIRWESYLADAKVQFAQDGDVLATAQGKWIKRPHRYSRDEYVYITSRDGSKTLIEIHFSGENRALVFRDAS